MQYSPSTDEESVRWCDAESGRQSTPETTAFRLAAKDVRLPSQPEVPSRISRSEEAVVVSVPGTEYWLP
jgi:hypothetical protein